MKDILKRVYGKSREEYYSNLAEDMRDGKKRFVITANPEILVMSEKDGEIEKMLNDPDVSIIPDGIAVVKAARMLDIPVTERIAGVETAEFLLSEADRQQKKVYLFGAAREVVTALADKIAVDYPRIVLSGFCDGYTADKDGVFEEIEAISPDVCLVALGVPAQEKLIYKHIGRFGKGIFVGVGGSFDVLSGAKKRAPEFFLKHNIEWLYRIVKEPKRLKRFFDNNVKFLFKIKRASK